MIFQSGSRVAEDDGWRLQEEKNCKPSSNTLKEYRGIYWMLIAVDGMGKRSISIDGGFQGSIKCDVTRHGDSGGKGECVRCFLLDMRCQMHTWEQRLLLHDLGEGLEASDRIHKNVELKWSQYLG